MKTPQEILGDSNFQQLPLGERLKVMRQVDPNFAGLSPREQGTVLYTTHQRVMGLSGRDGDESKPDAGFVNTLVNDVSELPGAAMNAVQHPIETGKRLVGAQVGEFQKVPGLVKQGRYSEAVGHGMAGALPLVGPAAAQAGDELGQGQTGQGLAHTAELLGPSAGKLGTKALKGTAVGSAASQLLKSPEVQQATREMVESIPVVGKPAIKAKKLYDVIQKARKGTPGEQKLPSPMEEGKTDAPKPASAPDHEHAFDNLTQSGSPRPGGSVPKESYIKANRTVKARALARWFKINGIKPETVAAMTPEHWKAVAGEVGVSVPSPETIKQIFEEMAKK